VTPGKTEEQHEAGHVMRQFVVSFSINLNPQ
jgi:hypothetical protein